MSGRPDVRRVCCGSPRNASAPRASRCASRIGTAVELWGVGVSVWGSGTLLIMLDVDAIVGVVLVGELTTGRKIA
jgi:hypothetical protein